MCVKSDSPVLSRQCRNGNVQGFVIHIILFRSSGKVITRSLRETVSSPFFEAQHFSFPFSFTRAYQTLH